MSSPRQPPLPPLLPQELIDAIVDNLRGDKESLASCSLACRAWSTRSSRYLCHRSLCRVTKISALLESLVKSERLPFSMRELILEGVASADRDDELKITSLSALLARLPKLHVLELRRVHLQDSPTSCDMIHSEVKVLDLPPFALQLLKLRDIAELQSLDKVLRLFSSITELSLEGVRSARSRPSPIRTPIDTTIQRLVCVKSEPTVLSAVLKEIQGFITPRLVHLTMDDGIFFHTHLAMKFNTLLRQVGPMLESIHFKITPENYSLSAPGTSLSSLDTCSNLRSLGISLPLCTRGGGYRSRNIINFAAACDIIRSVCYRAPVTTDRIRITIHVQNEDGSSGYEAAMVNLGKLPWHILQDALESFGSSRGVVSPEKGMFFHLMGEASGSQEVSWSTEGLKSILKTALSSEAFYTLRFV